MGAAASISRDEARRVVCAWTGRDVVRVDAHATTNGVPFFAVKMANGGTVFTAGETSRSPVIAFTGATNDFSTIDRDSPLWALLNADLSRRTARTDASVAWRRVLAGTGSKYISMANEPTDLRVPAIVQSQWGQSGASGKRCYNYFTPLLSNGSHALCGCVATAMAQVMRYHRWPSADSAVPCVTNTCFVQPTYAGGVKSGAIELSTQGGHYDWDNMPLQPGLPSDEVCAAIGALTRDAGIAVHMCYDSDGSAAFSFLIPDAFRTAFGYASAAHFAADEDVTAETGVLERALFANFDAGHPVLLGINAVDSGGHAVNGHSVVADGYGFADGLAYVHLNMGWKGDHDLWYNLPNIGGGYGFSCVADVAYNVFPTNGPGTAVLSGRVLEPSGGVASNAVVEVFDAGTPIHRATTVVTACGIYAFILPAGSYDVRAISADGFRTNCLESVKLAAPVLSSYDVTCPIVSGWNEVFPTKSYVDTVSRVGNSWGNDISLTGTWKELYVDADAGDDATALGTVDAPFATISAAVAVAADGATVWVRPGTYVETVVAPSKTLRIESTEGPEVTVIDADGQHACYVGSANKATVLAGFTLENGQDYGGVYGGTVSNCVIRNCSAFHAKYGGGAYGATVYDSVIHDCAASSGGGASDSTLVRCTVYGNEAASAGGVDDCQVTDSIVWGNRLTSGETGNWRTYRSWNRTYTSQFTSCCTYPTPVSGSANTTNDPRFVSLAIDDWRLRAGSPCLGSASNGGNMGAWQGVGVVGHTLTARAERGAIEPTSIFVEEGGSATFKTGTDHPLIRIETNGVFATEAATFTWENVAADGEVVAYFGATNFFVDAKGGDDANDGWSWTTAKASITSAVEVVQSGETVTVRPGVYRGGISVLATNVTLVSTGGADETIVDAEGDGLALYDVNGGTAAIGFTFQNGDCSGGEYYGGAVYGGVLSNCVLRGSASFFGGGVVDGQLVNCVISNCTAHYGGGALYSKLVNCLVVGNTARETAPANWRVRPEGGLGGGAYECEIIQSTIARNEADVCAGGVYAMESSLCNSIVATNVCLAGYANGNDVYGNMYWSMVCTLSDRDARFVDAEHGDFHLSVHSPAVDAGTNELVATATDLDGADRIFGARVDMGCHEFRRVLPVGWSAPVVAAGASPEEERLAVAQAMRATGFPEATAKRVTTLADYNRLNAWAEERGISAAVHAASPMALLSPALGADGLLTLTSDDVRVTGFGSTEPGSWCFMLDFPQYDPKKVDSSLLRSAVGVVGSPTLNGAFSSDDLVVVVEPRESGVKASVTPPPASASYLFRAVVK